jgi:hypothetical protein
MKIFSSHISVPYVLYLFVCKGIHLLSFIIRSVVYLMFQMFAHLVPVRRSSLFAVVQTENAERLFSRIRYRSRYSIYVYF